MTLMTIRAVPVGVCDVFAMEFATYRRFIAAECIASHRDIDWHR